MKYFFLILLILSQTCNAQSEEDCKIYTKAFREIVRGNRFVILEKEDTAYLNNSNIIRKFYDTGYTQSNSINFNKFLCFNIKTNIISQLKLDKFFDTDSHYKKFHHTYPGAHGFIIISRIFYNKKSDKALFYLSYHKGYLNAAGLYVTMKKNENNEWEIENCEVMWAS